MLLLAIYVLWHVCFSGSEDDVSVSGSTLPAVLHSLLTRSPVSSFHVNCLKTERSRAADCVPRARARPPRRAPPRPGACPGTALSGRAPSCARAADLYYTIYYFLHVTTFRADHRNNI